MKNGGKQMATTHYKRFDFYFYESTGDNRFIDVSNVQHAITFDTNLSDKNALNSLNSLKWNVLYANAKGGIKVYGKYNIADSSFILVHWWLKAPFTLYSYVEVPFPDSSPLIQKEKLTAEDFEVNLDCDPEIYNGELNARQR